MSKVVVDASVILAFLNRETGNEEIAKFLPRAAISSVNFSEVVAKLADSGMPQEEIAQLLSSLHLEVISFNTDHALRAGILRPLTKALGLSLGDRACLALGLALNLPILTTDRAWEALTLPIEIRVMR